MREAVATMKDGMAIQKRVLAGADFSTRLLTDLTGRNYTLVFELTLPNVAAFESFGPKLFADKDWQANYHRRWCLSWSLARSVSVWVVRGSPPGELLKSRRFGNWHHIPKTLSCES
jgi:hypothetical protein